MAQHQVVDPGLQGLALATHLADLVLDDLQLRVFLPPKSDEPALRLDAFRVFAVLGLRPELRGSAVTVLQGVFKMACKRKPQARQTQPVIVPGAR